MALGLGIAILTSLQAGLRSGDGPAVLQDNAEQGAMGESTHVGFGGGVVVPSAGAAVAFLALSLVSLVGIGRVGSLTGKAQPKDERVRRIGISARPRLSDVLRPRSPDNVPSPSGVRTAALSHR